MTPKTAKAKGRGFQQKIRDMILEEFPELAGDDCVSTSMGAGGEDIRLSPAARKRLPVQIECKKRKAIAVFRDYEQCAKHGAHEPLVFLEEDRRKPLVLMDAKFFIRLLAGAA